MAGDQAAQKTGLSLYANLLENESSSTVTGAPVTYTQESGNDSKQDDAAKRQQALAASIRFQPTKRPQLAAQKAKAKAIASKLANITSSITDTKVPSEVLPAQNAPKTTAADWTATVSEDEDTHAYYAGTRPRGKKRKKKHKEISNVQQDWDDVYDPSRPNNYEDYKHSEEKIREVREWKDLLYRHRMRRTSSSSYDSDRADRRTINRQFAPPPSSPPPPPPILSEPFADEGGYSPPPPPPDNVAPHVSGEDAYLRRLQLSQPSTGTAQMPPSPPSARHPSNQISRAPVRYNFPPPPPELDVPDAVAGSGKEPSDLGLEPEAPRSNRPGQKGFAERLLSKYGWTKGSGLGAKGQGIINPLYAKADKRKKKSDAEGGGYATPAGTGKILGGNKSKDVQKDDEGRFGAMSEVIKLNGMLDGMDVQAELQKTDEENGGLMQEIGEECGEKYGSVERVFIHIPDDNSGAVVFVRFISQLSALRAVNALEGRVFNGNTITARFWDREKFEEGVYV